MENLLNIIMDFQWSPKGLEEIVNRIQKDILKERLSPLAIQSKMNLPNKFPDHQGNWQLNYFQELNKHQILKDMISLPEDLGFS